ncbi:MAG: phosphodiesterase [Desulfovibrionaceae bacterium]
MNAQRFVIASDLHGSPERTAFVCERVRELKPDSLILLGDILYHGPRNPLPLGYKPLDTVELLAALDIPIIAVRGNCDAEVDLVVLPFPVQENAWILVDDLRIFACHGHNMPLDPPYPHISQGTVVLRGHTHIPVAHSAGGVHVWNPGSISLPKQGYPPSWACYERGEFRVMDMQGKVFLSHKAGKGSSRAHP